MGSGGETSTKPESSEEFDASISELKKRHKMDLENLTLTSRPFKTLQLFLNATLQYARQSFLYIFSRGIWLITLIVLVGALCFLIFNVSEPNLKHIEELGRYTSFVLWWVALGVASSIGLGSGLHTFVLYLGPHIAFFTIKAMKCGRVDLKTAPYDTIQLKSSPSWLDKDCSEFGPALFSPLPGSLVKVPVMSVLPHVQLEAILWGLGTALGELPPYFISRAASSSGSKMEEVDGLDMTSSKEDGFLSAFLKKIKRGLFSHSRHLNFWTILILASVPNPLFDLAGIMCGQFGIPFWEFFLATSIGKALIKTHIQTFFIIALCNNQLLEWVENELIRVLGLIPGFSSKLPELISKLKKVQEKYLSSPAPSRPAISDEMAKPSNLSFGLIWNTVIWLMLLNFFAKIVTSTAQSYLKKQQDLELQLALESKQDSSS